MELQAALDETADRFAALACAPRILIVRLLLAAHKVGGLAVGQIQAELQMPGSTLTHHLEKLKRAGLLECKKDRQWIRCSVNLQTLRQMLGFLYEECCTRNEVVEASPEWAAATERSACCENRD